MKIRNILAISSLLLLCSCGSTTNENKLIVRYVDEIKKNEKEEFNIVDFYSWEKASVSIGAYDNSEEIYEYNDTYLITTYNLTYWRKTNWYCGMLRNQPKVFQLDSEKW